MVIENRIFAFIVLPLTLSLSLTGCGLLGMGGGGGPDEEVSEEGEPEVAAETPPSGGPFDDTISKRQFFEVKQDITALRTELARIKSDINAYTKTPQTIRTTEPGFGFLEPTEITHKVTLSNGTEVLGKITRETLDDIVLITQIGTLTIDRRQIRDIAPAEMPRAECQIVGDIGNLETRVYADRRVYTGFVKNIGERRADFVVVKIKLAREDTRIIAVDSAYVDGINFRYKTGVISDTSISPKGSAPFSITVYLPPNAEVSYYTSEVHWKEYD
ncbi:MAG: hypothetical protein IH825_07495 [Candidatus Marinimicrobia bacterium]|nr:hypothetical protein [Candidatus Neomarinimicrobiota bacterium]